VEMISLRIIMSKFGTLVVTMTNSCHRIGNAAECQGQRRGMIGLDTIHRCVLPIGLSKVSVDLQDFLKAAIQYHRPRAVFILPQASFDSR
jgi:hypothetical protein